MLTNAANIAWTHTILMFWMDKKKIQPDETADARRSARPRYRQPGHAPRPAPAARPNRAPKMAGARCQRSSGHRVGAWPFRITGLVCCRRTQWSWEEFGRSAAGQDFLRISIASLGGQGCEICGKAYRRASLIRHAGGALPAARVRAGQGFDRGWTTELPLADFLSDDALVALLHDGEPLPRRNRAVRRG